MKAKCITVDLPPCGLTVGTIYDATPIGENLYRLVNDYGSTEDYNRDQFVIQTDVKA
jgi:hypothetical protein